MTVQEKVKKARVGLLLDQPFFGSLLTRLKMIEKPNSNIIATDGENIFYDPILMDSYSLPVVKGILAHETMHPAFLHHCRGKGKDHETWNKACDYAINDIILKANLELPKDILYNSQFKNMSAEEIYNIIYKSSNDSDKNGEKQEQGKGQNTSNNMSNSSQNKDKIPKWGDVIQSKEKSKQEVDWKTSFKQAMSFAEQQGKTPGGMERFIKEVINPEVPWETILRDFVDRTARNDYSFKRPNARYIQSGFYLPSLISNELPEIVIAIDTSGSISDKDIAKAEGELQSISDLFNTTIKVLYCDSHLHEDKIQEFQSNDVIKLKPFGGGGTSFIPVFDYISKNEEPSCLIYFTDMYGSFPNYTPDYPVLWINTGNGNNKPPFGEYFKIHQ